MRPCSFLPGYRPPKRKKLGRKRITWPVTFLVLFLSVALTCLSLVILVSHQRNFHNSGAGWEWNSTAINSACNKTLYPAVCLSTLLSYPKAERENPKKFAHIALNVTMARAKEAYSETLKVAQDMKSTEEMALEDCMELLQDSIDRLKHSLAVIAEMGTDPSKTQIVDIETWLSEAFENQETCFDGLQESSSNINAPLQERFLHLSKLISNALAIVQNSFLENSLETHYMFHVSHPLQHRRRPFMVQGKEMSEEFPERMSKADQRLLRSPNAAVLVANVTAVAQDGSGHYKTITEAVKNAPSNSSKRYVIFVKRGVYNENVVLSKKKTNLMLIGEGRTKTIVASHRNVKDGSTTFRSATFASGRGF